MKQLYKRARTFYLPTEECQNFLLQNLTTTAVPLHSTRSFSTSGETVDALA